MRSIISNAPLGSNPHFLIFILIENTKKINLCDKMNFLLINKIGKEK